MEIIINKAAVMTISKTKKHMKLWKYGKKEWHLKKISYITDRGSYLTDLDQTPDNP